MNYLYDFGILLLFALLILYGARRSPISSNHDYARRLNRMRGIFAIEIVIGHVVRYNNTLLYPFGKVMIVSVAFYLFISAYGLANSFYRKENYLNTFPKSKFLYLLILSIIAYAFTCGVELVSGITISYLPESPAALPVKYLTLTNWYIWELLLWYIIFFLLYRFIPGKKSVWIASLLGMAGGTFFFFMDFPQGWYCSILAFPLGLAFYEYNDQFLLFLKSIRGKLITLLFTVLGLTGILFSESSFIGMVLLRNILCIAGMFLLLYVLCHFEFGNSISDFLGKISAEIYLFQFPWLRLTQSMSEQYTLRLPIVLVCTLITAIIFHAINNLWKPLVQKKSARQ